MRPLSQCAKTDAVIRPALISGLKLSSLCVFRQHTCTLNLSPINKGKAPSVPQVAEGMVAYLGCTPESLSSCGGLLQMPELFSALSAAVARGHVDHQRYKDEKTKVPPQCLANLRTGHALTLAAFTD